MAIKTSNRKIWIDLDNTPHVPFFEPIIQELKERGYEVLVTARDAFQVCELADSKGLSYLRIGRHYGKNKLIKFLGLIFRAVQLAPTVFREKPALALSHGSRSQIFISNIARIPAVLIADYEFAQNLPLMRPRWEILPEVIPESRSVCLQERVRKYPGIKEDVYVCRSALDSRILAEIGIVGEPLIITVRPPATEAHYHNPASEPLFYKFMERAIHISDVVVVLLPRNRKQESEIRSSHPGWFQGSKTIIPKHAIDGMNLIWHSDLVVSGGGTMNREAAALGVPVYSIFRGRIGAVDQYLEQTGRLTLISSTEDVDNKILIKRRERDRNKLDFSNKTMDVIVAHVEDILEREQSL